MIVNNKPGPKSVRWADSRKIVEGKPLAIPEPLHRISALSSGASLRTRARGSVAAVQKVCQAYEAKCAGKYSSKTLASRYVFDMSCEVQKILRDVEETLHRRASRIEELELTMQEWEETFSPVYTCSSRRWLENAQSELMRNEEDAEQKDTEYIFSGGRIPLETKTGERLAALRIITPIRLKRLIDEYVDTISKLKIEIVNYKKDSQRRSESHKNELAHQAKVIRDRFQTESAHSNEQHSIEIGKLERIRRADKQQMVQVVSKAKETTYQAQALVDDLQRQLDLAEHKITELQQNVVDLEAECEKQKGIANKNWEHLMRKARREVQSQHEQELDHLKQQIHSLKEKQKEVEDIWERRMAKFEKTLVEPLENEILREQAIRRDQETENEYLRGRVKELNRLLRAYQMEMKV